MDLEPLYHELQGPVTRRLERMLGDAGAAEDLRQEAFARAWKSAPRDAGHGELRAWLHRTARNLAIDELRRRRIRDWVPYEDGLAPAHHDADSDERIVACAALEQLTPHERFVLLLRFEGGLSHVEIGRLLAISEEAARKRVARARAALRAAHRAITARAAARPGAARRRARVAVRGVDPERRRRRSHPRHRPLRARADQRGCARRNGQPDRHPSQALR